jgi:hypothetical protein
VGVKPFPPHIDHFPRTLTNQTSKPHKRQHTLLDSCSTHVTQCSSNFSAGISPCKATQRLSNWARIQSVHAAPMVKRLANWPCSANWHPPRMQFARGASNLVSTQPREKKLWFHCESSISHHFSFFLSSQK